MMYGREIKENIYTTSVFQLLGTRRRIYKSESTKVTPVVYEEWQRPSAEMSCWQFSFNMKKELNLNINKT